MPVTFTEAVTVARIIFSWCHVVITSEPEVCEGEDEDGEQASQSHVCMWAKLFFRHIMLGLQTAALYLIREPNFLKTIMTLTTPPCQQWQALGLPPLPP